jgi:uncharacterized protein
VIAAAFAIIGFIVAGIHNREGRNMTGGIRRPSESEEEYIARIEYQRRKKVEEGKHREMAEEEKRRRKELHFMHCPKCGMKLIEVDYRSLKVDRCSACGGLWLDAGELEAAVELEKGLLGRIFGL